MAVSVPPISDDEVSDVSASNATEAEPDLDSGDRRGPLPSTATEAEAQTDTSTSGGSLVTITSASLGPGFKGFLADTVEFWSGKTTLICLITSRLSRKKAGGAV